MSKKVVLYIHGKGGSASEWDHYKPLFPDAMRSVWIIRPLLFWKQGRRYIQKSLSSKRITGLVRRFLPPLRTTKKLF